MDRKQSDEAILAAFEEFGNQRRVAERLGLSQSTVSARLRRLGIHVGKGKAVTHRLPMDEVARRYRAGESTIELGAAYQVDPEVIRRRLHVHGTERRGLLESRARGSKNAQWKGGVRAMHWYRRESYEVAAICLGHPLHPAWVIHHVDENPHNNDPSNLVLFQSQGDHLRLHQRLQMLRRRGAPLDAIRMALESGGLRLPPPPAPIVFGRDIDPSALFERLASPTPSP
ncbi:MAG TPA: winged helix-turn-helix transcriptional regulator [Terriglobales bacterium]|nr:winged helix-turn-helix transcriptional regulator [Terriglobales bacterium]